MEPPPPSSSADAVERVANEVVSEAIDELFLSKGITEHYKDTGELTKFSQAELQSALLMKVEKLRDISPQIVLEIGCGSGVVSVFLNKALGGNVTSLATDYNPDALECTKETGRLNEVKIEVVRTDLYDGLDHLEERCWAGGPNGRGTVDRLLPRVSRLLSDKGVFYLVALHSNDIPALLCSCPDLQDLLRFPSAAARTATLCSNDVPYRLYFAAVLLALIPLARHYGPILLGLQKPPYQEKDDTNSISPNIGFIIEPSVNYNARLLVMVNSMPDRFEERQMIRTSWALPDLYDERTTKVLFLIGKP
ncbi:methyltransferase small domain protein, partial [Teladorsagia circumcincta]